MEVASVISSREDIVKLFELFLTVHASLLLEVKDNDTMYFSKAGNKNFEIYFHYQLDNVSKEFSYNYSLEEIDQINKYFQGSTLYIFDLSFRDQKFFDQIINDFRDFLIKNRREDDIEKVIISRPNKGIIKLK